MGYKGSFQIDLIEAIGMEVDNESFVHEDARDEVHNAKDLEFLEWLRLGNDSDDESIPPLEHAVDDTDGRDRDDDTYDPANPNLEEYF